MRKIATMLVALGLTFGLLGAGISATFSDQVTATQNMQVGDFECKITDATPKAASDGISGDGKSLTYSAPDILSGAPGSAPFSFTVKATGDIPVLLSVSHNATAPFGSLGNYGDVAMDSGESKILNVGLTWGDLAGYEGASLSITYTVDCEEVIVFSTFGSADVTQGPPGTYTIVSDDYDPVYTTSSEYGGVVFTSKTVGKTIGSVDYSFDRTGPVTGGAPRFSIPINGTVNYAFMDATSCGGATTISTTSPTCGVYYMSDPMYANWDAFAAAHPTYMIGGLPFVIVDGTTVPLGTFVLSNITETVTP